MAETKAGKKGRGVVWQIEQCGNSALLVEEKHGVRNQGKQRERWVGCGFLIHQGHFQARGLL